MKKGVLFTLGILMLVTIVFSLALLLFHNTQSMETRFSELALSDRLLDFDGMIQNNIKDINDYESGLFTTVGNDSVSFTESFPRSARFADVMADYEDYIEENYNISPKITLDDAKLSQITTNQIMYIMPYNIKYEHDGFLSESYELEPGTNYNKVSEYNISLKVNAVSAALDGDTLDIDTDPEDVKLYIKITSQEGSLLYAQEWKIDPNYDKNVVNINLFGTGGGYIEDVNVKVGPQSYLEVDPPASITRTSTLEIALTEPTDKPIEVKYDEDLFTIHFEESKLIKKGTVKLA